MLVAIGAGIAVLTGIGAGIGIGMGNIQSSRSNRKTARSRKARSANPFF